MITWLVAQIPFWVYITVALLFAAAMFYFLSPVLVPLWALTPRWVKIALGFVGSLLGTYLFALNRGSRAEREMQRQKEAKANEHREDNDRKIRNTSDSDLNKRFNKWLR